MASKSDKELRNEISYLTSEFYIIPRYFYLTSTIYLRFADLIETHKKRNVSHSKPNRPPKHGKNNKFKWTATRYDTLCICIYISSL